MCFGWWKLCSQSFSKNIFNYSLNVISHCLRFETKMKMKLPVSVVLKYCNNLVTAKFVLLTEMKKEKREMNVISLSEEKLDYDIAKLYVQKRI